MPQNYDEVLDADLTPVELLAADSSKESITEARTLLGSMKYTHEEMTGRIESFQVVKGKAVLYRHDFEGM